MTTANFVKKARKNYPDSGIKKGDSYWWWSFRFGGTYKSKTKPRRSQLTQSSFLSQLYDIEDDLNEMEAGEDMISDIDDIVQRLRDLASECEDNRSNMPDALQESETGQLLEERAEACNAAADELEGIDTEFPGADGDDDYEAIKGNETLTEEQRNAKLEEREEEVKQEFYNGVLEEVQGVSIDAP